MVEEKLACVAIDRDTGIVRCACQQPRSTFRTFISSSLGSRSLPRMRWRRCPTRSWSSPLDAESNSLAVIMKHMAGNLRSRFTDFLTTDGEKPDRNRDGEFEIAGTPNRAPRSWRTGRAAGHGCSPDLESLTDDDDPNKEVRVRGEALSAPGARPPDDAPRVPRRPDRLSRQAFTVAELEEPEHPPPQS